MNEAGGYGAARALMKDREPPTAILFNNDALALGGCRALGELCLQPGRDVAGIVIVDSPLCSYLSPALTGFSVRLEPLGRRLAEMLLASMPRYAGPDRPQILREVWPLNADGARERRSVHEPGDQEQRGAAACPLDRKVRP